MCDLHPSFCELCFASGICPLCHYDFHDCRCLEDAEVESEVGRHPAGCVCCLFAAPVSAPGTVRTVEYPTRAP